MANSGILRKSSRLQEYGINTLMTCFHINSYMYCVLSQLLFHYVCFILDNYLTEEKNASITEIFL